MLCRLLFLVLAIFISGCATIGGGPPSRYTLTLKNVDWPLQDLQGLVASQLPTGLRSTSANGREFYSKHFVLDGAKYKPAGDAVDRYTATVIVLGDQRPYDVEIFVTHEKRVLRDSGFDYEEVGYNMLLARELEYKIKTELAKHREDRNIIDDFRVF